MGPLIKGIKGLYMATGAYLVSEPFKVSSSKRTARSMVVCTVP